MFDKVKGWLAGAIIILLAAGGGYLYYENNQLQKDLISVTGEKELLDATNKIYQNTNAQLADQVQKNNQSATVTNEVNKALEEQRTALAKEFEGLRKITQQKFAEIDSKYSKMEDTPANKELRRVEIGMERSRGIWRMYCISEPLAEECVQ